MLILVLAGSAQAQQQLGPLSVGGSVGVSTEAYSVSGIEARRPLGSARVFANTSFNLFGLSSGFSLTYSSAESRLSRSANRLAFATSWQWGRAAAGDVSPSISAYSLRGTVVRGAEVAVQPGAFLVEVAVGQARDAPSVGGFFEERNPEMRRWVYAGRVGYGRESDTHLHLMGLYVRDAGGAGPEDSEVRPAKNTVLGSEAGLLLLDGRLRMEGEIAASAISRDREAPTAGAEELPFYFQPFMAGRVGTVLSYAGNAEAEVRLRRGSLRAAYERILPGYATLGVARLRSDQETIRLQPQVRLLERRLALSLTASQTRNNLLDTRTSTLTRRQLGTTAQMRFTPGFFVTGNLVQLFTTNELHSTAAPGALDQRITARTFSLTPTLTLPRPSGSSHNLALNATYQAMRDRSEAAGDALRPSLDSDNLTGTLSYTRVFASRLNVSASTNALRSDAGTTETSVYGGTLGAGYPLLDGTLQLNASAGATRSVTTVRPSAGPEVAASRRLIVSTGTAASVGFQDPLSFEDPLELSTSIENASTQLTFNLTGSYRLPNDDPVRLQVRTLSNLPEGGGRRFTEVRATLRYSHRF